MDKGIVAALAAAVLTGVAIGVQGMLVREAERGLGAIRTGLLVNVAGGTLSLGLLALLSLAGGTWLLRSAGASAPAWIAAGVLGTAILTGMAFTLPRAGIAAGLAGVIVGQLVAAVAIDTAGIGASRIPLTSARLLGLALLVAGVVLLLPRR